MIRKLHAFLGLFSAIFILLLTISGLFLNYPNLLSGEPRQHAFQQHPQHLYDLGNDLLVLKTKDDLFYSKDAGFLFVRLRHPFIVSDIVSMVSYDSHVYVALSSGMLYRANIRSKHWVWSRVAAPQMAIYSDLSAHDGSLLLLGDTGLHRYTNKKWTELQVNTSPTDLHYMVKAMHAGVYPFTKLKIWLVISAFSLLYLTLSGLILYVRNYTKLLTKKTQ